jgi:hypothetical protein
MPALTAQGPVLVHFLDVAQLNSVRAMPYVLAWRERYADAGLATLAVHSPRFPFTARAEALAAGRERLGIEHPTADDSAYRLWHAYGCEGWPSLFLWAKGGALAWFHFGEGEYLATEEAIQSELRAAGFEGELPAPLEPLRPTDAPGALVVPPTEEIFPGGSHERPWIAGEQEEELEIEYAAGGAFASIDGDGELAVELDDEASRSVSVEGPALVELAERPRHELHRLRLRPSPGVRIWSISFAAGVR